MLSSEWRFDFLPRLLASLFTGRLLEDEDASSSDESSSSSCSSSESVADSCNFLGWALLDSLLLLCD